MKKLIFIVILIAGLESVFSQAFEKSLPVPGLLQPHVDASGSLIFDLEARRGSTEFFPSVVTPTMGFNGSYLGPTIRVRNGQDVSIRVRNSIDEITTVHWHGLHVPAEMDGGPHQVIEPDKTWTASFTVRQEAATFWYHPHALGKTGEQVYAGLAGLFIIDDDSSDALDLPHRYGVDDIPLVFQDRRFFEDGRFAYVTGMPDVMQGIAGEHLLVNGASKPVLDIPRGLVRLRLLNGSDSGVYRFRFADSRPFYQIATDGGFLEYPIELTSAIVSTGERIEILVDFSSAANGDEILVLVDTSFGSTFESMLVRVSDSIPSFDRGDGNSGDSDILAMRLNDIERFDPDTVVKQRNFEMQTMGPGGQLTINGKRMAMDRIDERVALGSVETWVLDNPRRGMMQIPHSFHLHDVQFLIIDINGVAPPPQLSGWKDTVLLWPGDRVRITARFDDYTGLYMYHCHLLVHEDAGMMGQFEVY